MRQLSQRFRTILILTHEFGRFQHFGRDQKALQAQKTKAQTESKQTIRWREERTA